MTTPRPARGRRLLIGGTAAVALLLGAATTTASYTDRTHAVAELVTETWATAEPELVWASSTAAFLAEGTVYPSGYRGNGVSGTGVATVDAASDPTPVDIPVPVVKVVGGTNDFDHAQVTTTWLAALGSDGVVYQWGANYARSIVGGTDDRPQAITEYAPTGGTTRLPLPPIVDLASSENQLFAVDAEGVMYAWGYAGENLPNPVGGALARTVPVPAVIAVDQVTGLADVGVVSGDTIVPGTVGGAREVRWHRVYGGQNSAFGVTREGLVYVWGYDSHAGVAAEATIVNQRAPRDARGVNALLFEEFPDVYHAADGTVLRADDPAYWTTYDRVYQDMKAREVCTEDHDATEPYDGTGCPVRQLGTGARAYRLLLSDHRMYTWAASTGTYGWTTIGRSVTSIAATAGGYVPGLVETSPGGPTLAVDHFSAGTSAVQAVTVDGRVYGWGANNWCQAIGTHSTDGVADPGRNGGDCDIQGATVAVGLRPAGGVWYPAPVWGLREDVVVTSVGGTACTTWLTAEDGTVYAFGGSTVVGVDYRSCTVNATQGFRVYDLDQASGDAPFGPPLAVRATATRPVLGS